MNPKVTIFYDFLTYFLQIFELVGTFYYTFLELNEVWGALQNRESTEILVGLCIFRLEFDMKNSDLENRIFVANIARLWAEWPRNSWILGPTRFRYF